MIAGGKGGDDMGKKYFYGNEISEYGLQYGRVDYRCLAKCFDAVLNNDVIKFDVDNWEQVHGFIDNSDEIDERRERIERLEDVDSWIEDRYSNAGQEKYMKLWEKLHWKCQNKISVLEDEINELENETEGEVFQWYIVSDGGAELLKRETNEILYYNGRLDMYLWGVTHWGTSWDYVLTDIKIDW